MSWNSLPDFLAMGGHGLYVWGSFALVAAALGLEWLVERALRPATGPGRGGVGGGISDGIGDGGRS